MGYFHIAYDGYQDAIIWAFAFDLFNSNMTWTKPPRIAFELNHNHGYTNAENCVMTAS